MPYTSALRQNAVDAADEDAPSIKVHDIPLWLPSSLSATDPCDANLQLYEWRLRKGQAFDALHKIRQGFRQKSHRLKVKQRFMRGVAENNRSNDGIKRAEAVIEAAASKYRIAYAALTALHLQISNTHREPNWTENLQVLRDTDLRGMSEGLENDSEGRRSISWIWRIEGVADGEQGEQELEGKSTMFTMSIPNSNQFLALCIEWCRARARYMRFEEEVELLEEEMCRVLVFLEWQSNWWLTKGNELLNNDCDLHSSLCEGLTGYRNRQAALRLALRDGFKVMWKDIPQFVEEGRKKIEEMRKKEAQIRIELV